MTPTLAEHYDRAARLRDLSDTLWRVLEAEPSSNWLHELGVEVAVALWSARLTYDEQVFTEHPGVERIYAPLIED